MNLINRRKFLVGTSALFAAAGSLQAKAVSGSAQKAKKAVVLPPTAQGPLKVRFIGTGAADWLDKDKPAAVAAAAPAPSEEAAPAAPAEEAAPAAPAEAAPAPAAAPEWRRHASVLLDDKVLVDFTASAADMIPAGVKIEDVVITHSHPDHFDPAAVLALGTVQRVYVDRGWAREARSAFIKAGQGWSGVDVVPVDVGETFAAGGLHFTPLPANHDTGNVYEQTLIYRVDKDQTRLLYATDTAGITAMAQRLLGKFNAMIMEATVGMNAKDNWRIFSHTSVELVAQTVSALKFLKQYEPPEGRKVYTTHMSKALHGPQAELEANFPEGVVPAKDGLEVEF
ncbi:MAG: MBL fold metallo-hydrolase [Kiritimatiellae bacterium]|nr:MBL fold metallo-hydrolase [Kiritimatiellia bacterium]